MIRHIVLFKFKDGFSWENAEAKAAEELTLSHPAHIPDIAAWQAGRNVAERPDSYDFAVIGDFADRDALQRYMVHPHHQQGVAAWRRISTWVVADLEFDTGAAPRIPR